MKDINIVIDSQTHKVQFPDNFLGLNAENLQGNINFTFTNGFVNGIARLELSIDCESGFIPNLQNTGDSYTLPILSSLLTSDNIVMQLVIEQTDLITYKLTTDTSINNQKTYYTRSGVEGEYVYTIVENPKVADIGTYYEAQIPIFKTHIFNMTVGESINAVNTIPDDYPTWIDTLNSLVGQVNAKIIEMNQALAEVDNLDITATKEGTTVTITITRKDGSQQVVTITDGKDGVGIEKIEKTDTTGLIDTYTIYYTDDSTSTFQVKNGRGIVSIDKTDTNILTDTYTITYNDNTTSTFYVVNGNGVESIVKIGTSGLIDTYRISYTNGEYYDYQVANGNGIDNIQKTDTTGLVDTYTITYTNGTTSTYIITNGNGISNIAKTSTVDNVDTYTIYYTNGTTSTFTVTNSTVTNQEFQELQRLVDYNALYANALIKMNNSGTELTINDTAEAPMPMKLGANTEQASTTGKNMFDISKVLNFLDRVINNGNGTLTINAPADSAGVSGNSPNKLKDYCPSLQVGDTVYLNATSTGNTKFIYLTTSASSWNFGTSRTITQNDLDSRVVWYASGVSSSATISEIMISTTGGDYEPYTGEIPAPSPDYPQDIHTISGDNEIKVENVNLAWNGWAENFVSRINSSFLASITTKDNRNCLKWNPGVGYNNYDNKYIFKTNWKENTQYTIKCSALCASANTRILQIHFTDGTTSAIFLVNTANTWEDYTYTSPANKTIKYITDYYQGQSKYIDLDTFMVYEGAQNIDYVPYQEQSLPLNLGDLEYCKTGNYEDEFVIPSGSNICNVFNIDNTSVITINSNQTITLSNNTSTNGFANTNKTLKQICPSLEVGDKIYLYIKNSSDKNYFYNQGYGASMWSYDTTNGQSQNPYTITQEMLNGKIVLYGGYQATDTARIMISKAPITNYEPYNNGKWYLKKNVGKVVLDGSENWINDLTGTNTYRFAINNEPLLQNNTNGYCYNNKWVLSGVSSDTQLVGKVGGNLYYRINKSIIDNLTGGNVIEKFVNFLTNNNSTCYAPLITPEYIPLNDTLQSQLTEIYKWVKSYQDQTNISQVNNDLPFIINTITCYDLNKLLTRVEVLESEV